MAALRELLIQFGIEVDDKQLDHANEKIDGFIEKVKGVGKALIGAFAVKEIFEFAEGVAHQIHQVERTAVALGIGTQAVQEIGYASQAAGEDAQFMLSMMGRLQVSAANAGKSGGQVAQAFHKLGVSTKDASGQLKPADALFGDVAEGIKNTSNATERAALATALFGRAGRQMLPFLIKGKDGVRAMRAEFDQLGGGFDEEAIKKSAEFEHSMAKIKVVVDGIKGAIVKGLFPVLGWIVDKAAAIGGWFVRIAKGTNIVRNGLLMLGAYLAPLAIQMAVAFAPILLAGAAVLGLVLLVDDLITMFEGGESVIGDVVDKIFGKGSSSDLIKEAKREWNGVKEAFVDMWPYVKAVYEAMKWIVEHAVELGDAIGDYAGKKDFGEGGFKYENAKQSAAQNRSGLSDEQNSAKRQGTRMADAQGSGQPFALTEIPASYKGFEKQFLDAVTVWAGNITTQRQTAVMSGMPGMTMPGGGGDTNITVEVQGSTSMDEPALKRAVAAGVRDAHQQANRSAKHVLTQAGQKP